MKNGELWEPIQRVLYTFEHEPWTLDRSGSCLRSKSPMVLLEKIYNDRGQWCAWKVLTKYGIMYTFAERLLEFAKPA